MTYIVVEDTRQSAFGPELGHLVLSCGYQILVGVAMPVLKIWKMLKTGVENASQVLGWGRCPVSLGFACERNEGRGRKGKTGKEDVHSKRDRNSR